ncbi:unnamed protein product [Dovyalis caffra]|uniref:Uncharacterized protein n=1 Tax=Dovyalis caffra TaxID=77055 RepID=A0AAV1R4R3_9ROSI|nr:unnamed protein product [Dovyalis caffra]
MGMTDITKCTRKKKDHHQLSIQLIKQKYTFPPSLTQCIAKSRAISARNLTFGGYDREKSGVLRAMEKEERALHA